MTDNRSQQCDAFVTPGTLLRAAREARGMDQAEVADRLHWLPGYVAIIEADDHQSLRRPAFARGYVRAYGKMLGVDEAALLSALEGLDVQQKPARKRTRARPPQLQRTGAGVVLGLLVLLFLVLALWWWRGEGGDVSPMADAPATAANGSGPAQAAGKGER